MKRSPLKRSTALRRGRRKPRGVNALIWRARLDDELCVVCGAHHMLDAHHAIPRRVLIWHGLEAHLNDLRNRVPTCRHDHEAHENRHRPIRRCELPDSVCEFAAELGLEWYLDRHYPVEVAA